MFTHNHNDSFFSSRDSVIKRHMNHLNTDSNKHLQKYIIKNLSEKTIIPSHSTPKKKKLRKIYNSLLMTQLFPEKKTVSSSLNKQNKNNNINTTYYYNNRGNISNIITKSTKDIKNKKFQPLFSNSNSNLINLNLYASNKQQVYNMRDYIKSNTKFEPKQIKVLEAPGLLDDYYLHLLSWSKDDIICVCLSQNIYLYNNKNGNIIFLNEKDKEFMNISSCLFLDDPEKLIIGYPNGMMYLYDIVKHNKISDFQYHTERVGVLDSLYNNPYIFFSGSKDRTICLCDIRNNNYKPIRIYNGNYQEICGLKVSKSSNLFASGSNDNRILIYSFEYKKAIHCFNNAHLSAVRALDWSSCKYNYLASGGGAQDRCIKFWNCSSMKFEFKVETDSQICNLAFGNKSNQLVTTHGYNDNKLNIWELQNNWDGIVLKDSFTAHQDRVLYMANSYNNRSIVTGSGDETIRIWNVFDYKQNNYFDSLLDPNNLSLR